MNSERTKGMMGKKESARRCLHPSEDTYVSGALRQSIGFTIPSLDGFIYTSVYTGGNVTWLSLSLQGTFI